MERRRFLGRGCRPGPSHDLFQGGSIDSETGLPTCLRAGQADRGDRRGRAEIPGHPEDGRRTKDIVDTLRVSWHERLKMLEHLLLEDDGRLRTKVRRCLASSWSWA